MDLPRAIKSLGKGWFRAMSDNVWVTFWKRDPHLQNTFLSGVEAAQWDAAVDEGVTLAATDGSMDAARTQMGAGVAFAPTNIVDHLPIQIRVGGKPASLRAEAAALIVLIEELAIDEPAIVLIDSLGLLQIIRNWSRFDFAPMQEYHDHYDLL